MSYTTEHVADRVERIERELMAWGAYRASGCAGDGYPGMSVIHPNWTPPASGLTPRMPMARMSTAREKALDDRIQELSVKLRDALFVVYVKRLPVAQRAAMLGCQPCTVNSRVGEAKRLLSM